MYCEQVMEESECQDDHKLQAVISVEAATETVQKASFGF